MQPGNGARIEEEPRLHVRVTGVRPTSGGDDTKKDHDGRRGHQTPGQESDGGMNGRHDRRVADLSRTHHEQDAHGNESHRDQEVRGDGGGVQTRENGDSSENRLHDGAGEGNAGQDSEGGASFQSDGASAMSVHECCNDGGYGRRG